MLPVSTILPYNLNVPFRLIENRTLPRRDDKTHKTDKLLSPDPILTKCLCPTFYPDEEFFTEGVRKAVEHALPSLVPRQLYPLFLHVGAPTELPPENILKGLEKFQSSSQVHVYGRPKGEPELLRAIANHVRNRYDFTIDSESEVCVTPGGCPAIYIILKELLQPGLVIFPSPGYPPYYTAAAKGRHDVCVIPLSSENNFMPDVEHVLKILEEAGKINDLRAIFVNYPHNPTGAVTNLGYLEKIVNLAREYGFLVFSDMAYSEVYNPEKKKPHSIFEIKDAKEVAIELYNLGKTFSMTGDRISYVIANHTIIGLFEAYLKHVHISSVPKPIQFAISAGLKDESCMKEVENRNIEYARRLELMATGLKSLGWQVDDFQRAGFFLWVPVPEKGKTSREFFNELLNKAGVVVVPGIDFGEEGEGYIRISITQPVPVLKEALTRLEANGFCYK